MKKYRLQGAAHVFLGFSKKGGKKLNGGLMRFERNGSNRLPGKCKQKVEDFFLRDDVSRMTTGRKQTETKNKQTEKTEMFTNRHNEKSAPEVPVRK